MLWFLLSASSLAALVLALFLMKAEGTVLQPVGWHFVATWDWEVVDEMFSAQHELGTSKKQTVKQSHISIGLAKTASPKRQKATEHKPVPLKETTEYWPRNIKVFLSKSFPHFYSLQQVLHLETTSLVDWILTTHNPFRLPKQWSPIWIMLTCELWLLSDKFRHHLGLLQFTLLTSLNVFSLSSVFWRSWLIQAFFFFSSSFCLSLFCIKTQAREHLRVKASSCQILQGCYWVLTICMLWCCRKRFLHSSACCSLCRWFASHWSW